MKIIDTHVHFWNYQAESKDFSWVSNEMAILKKDYLPDDLPLVGELLETFSSYKCVAVQARQSMEETLFLLKLAEDNPAIAGVVGWINWLDPEVGKTYTDFRKYKKLKGFRHVIQDEKKGFMQNSTFRHSIGKIAGRYTYDLLVKPPQIQEAIELVEEFPHQLFVLDHLAKPNIKNQDFSAWAEDIRKLKSFENLYCKLSGMVTEAHWHNWNESDFSYVMDVAVETFGPKRLMYGSDWPVCLLASDYKGVYDIVSNYLDKHPDLDKADIFNNNAVRFYNL